MSINNINKHQFQAHPYHMVDPSPWPISLSFALLILTISAVMYMHGFNYGGYFLNLGFILTATGMTLWFRDVIVEGTYLGHHTEQVKRGLTLGFALFIVSELMAFLSIFWAYFHSSLSPAVEIGGTWPKDLLLILIVSINIFYICYADNKKLLLFFILLSLLFICLLLKICFSILFLLHLDVDNFSTYLSSLFVSTSANDNVGQIKKRMSEYQNIPLKEVKKEFQNLKQNFNPSDMNLNPDYFKSFINGLYRCNFSFFQK